MSIIDIITAFIIISVFLFGFSQALLPAYMLWENVIIEYRTAKTIYFISESFKNECIKPNRNMENWRKLVSSAKELDSYTISELRKNDELWALKAVFIISGERVEVLGACMP